MNRWREAVAAATPVAVLGTLTCCVLPITLVALGLGSVMASLVSVTPWIVTLSRYKEWVFLGAAVMLAWDYWILYRSSNIACMPGGVCHPSHSFGRMMRWVFWASLTAFLLGLGVAYLTVPVLDWFAHTMEPSPLL